jgi:phosphoadenosine phosphosulfate reductase
MDIAVAASQPTAQPTIAMPPTSTPVNRVRESSISNTSTGMNDWTKLVFARLSNRFQHGSGIDLLGWAIETFGNGLSIGTGFGASGIVLMDLALQINPDVDIFYIDTGYFFPETLALIRQLEDHYQRSLRRVATDITVEQQAKRYGPDLYANDPNLCCQIRKVGPLKKALADSTAWVTALRHDQSSTRRDVSMVKWNERYNVVKIAPLAYWTEADIWQHVHERRLPYNTLHDQNYPSVGCWPCTKAVSEGDDLRAGRWQGTEKKECGLHWELLDRIAAPA